MMAQARRAAEREPGQALGLGEGVGEVGWMSTRQVRTATVIAGGQVTTSHWPEPGR